MEPLPPLYLPAPRTAGLGMPQHPLPWQHPCLLGPVLRSRGVPGRGVLPPRNPGLLVLPLLRSLPSASALNAPFEANSG